MIWSSAMVSSPIVSPGTPCYQPLPGPSMLMAPMRLGSRCSSLEWPLTTSLRWLSLNFHFLNCLMSPYAWDLSLRHIADVERAESTWHLNGVVWDAAHTVSGIRWQCVFGGATCPGGSITATEHGMHLASPMACPSHSISCSFCNLFHR